MRPRTRTRVIDPDTRAKVVDRWGSMRRAWKKVGGPEAGIRYDQWLRAFNEAETPENTQVIVDLLRAEKVSGVKNLEANIQDRKM